MDICPQCGYRIWTVAMMATEANVSRQAVSAWLKSHDMKPSAEALRQYMQAHIPVPRCGYEMCRAGTVERHCVRPEGHRGTHQSQLSGQGLFPTMRWDVNGRARDG